MDHIEKALLFKPGPKNEIGQAMRILKGYFSPTFSGMENINPDRPTLFVGNHTRFGILDAPMFIKEVYSQTDIYIRTLVDKAHLKIPLWRDYILNSGGVVGSRGMCSALMDAGESIIVFPGGAREVVKGKGLDYKLMWQERLGFVRMAIQHGYSITPFSSVGAEEAFSVVKDGEDIMNSFIGKLIRAAGLDEHLRGGELIMPLGRGIGLSMIPRPERFYFSVGKPIETEKYMGREEDKALLGRIQKQTANSINEMIKNDLLKRAQERHDQPLIRSLLQRT